MVSLLVTAAVDVVVLAVVVGFAAMLALAGLAPGRTRENEVLGDDAIKYSKPSPADVPRRWSR